MTERPYFKATNIPPDLHKQVKNIAKSNQQTVSKFIKEVLKIEVQKYPDFMKKD